MMETEDQVTATADEERMSDMKSDTPSEILSGHESHPTNMDSNPAAKVKKAGELAVLSFKVGGEEVLRGYIDKFVTLNTTGRVIAFASNNVAPLKLWMTNNVGGPESKSKADKILQFLIMEKKMTKMEAITIFKIGSGRWSKIRRSPDAKAPGKAYGLNGTQITDKDLSVLGAFVEGLDLIVSNQCGHLPAKRYCAVVDTWKALWNLYKSSIGNQERCMQYSTFHKHMRSKHPYFAVGKAKDEECDLCVRSISTSST